MIQKLFPVNELFQNYNSRKVFELKLHTRYNILLSYFHLENADFEFESVDVTHYLIYLYLFLIKSLYIV